MEFDIVKTLVKRKGMDARWVEEDISALTLRELFLDYRSILVQIEHPTYEDPRYMDLEEIRPLVKDIELTLPQWLNGLDGLSPPSHIGTLDLTIKKIFHVDARMAEFKVELERMGTHPDNDWPRGHLPDLLITKDGVDYQDLYDHCLVSVNGLIHRMSYSENGVYVVDGAYGMREANVTDIALTSFKEVGKLEVVDLTDDMIYQPNEELPLHDKTYLDLGKPLDGKTVMISIGGYLHVLDNIYQVVGDQQIMIDFKKYPMVQRYYESKGLVDISGYDFTEFDHNEDQRVTAELIRNDDWIRHLINCPSTFVVIVDASDIYQVKHQLEKTCYPGRYFAHSRPTLPLIVKRGMMKPYWAHEEDGIWVVNCSDNLYPNYQFEHNGYEELYSVAPQRVPSAPVSYGRGFLWEIGKETVIK